MRSPDFELKIVSLVRYVDACSPANRHGDCPFAVERQGERTCREECRGVVASLLRRGRSTPEQSLHAFDARQLRLSEPKGAPDILWHTSSLLQLVVAAARAHPIDPNGAINLRRFVDVTSALGALGCRGLDPDHLVRRGVAQYIKLGLAAWINKLQRSDDPRGDWEHANKWRTFFEESVPSEAASTMSYIAATLHGPAARRLDTWLESAPLEDILMWRPPTTPLESSSTALTGEAVETWTWIVDRFTQTYLDRWSLSSLKREYSFVKGAWNPNAPAELLSERMIASTEVATALADRTLRNDDLIDPAMMNALVDQALALLQDGQRNAAAALFEGARLLDPADKMTQNNYAFCILIDKPGEALRLLKDLLQRGAPVPAVTLCNIALAESLLGQTRAALEACEQACQSAKDGSTAILWQKSTKDWFAEYTDVRRWAVRFAAELEEAENASSSQWRRRPEQFEA
ncbi:hypothetical protein [Sphaerisporangium dianthi]|uniref:Tetratricopeptide repeat protein n=1 Tax=Sphaerisporangium dianthi TaxID=1436120 RepID=A0ABV9CMT8_9ACTN